MLTLTRHQQEIADKILSDHSMSLSLAGLAGTGKTTLIKYLHARMNGAIVLAPTGKAASVLRYKGIPADTIHRAIYQFKGKFETIDGKTELVFKDNRNGQFCDRLIIDEASMVTLRMKEDIESRGIPTLWVGDPGQLPPVKSPPNGLLNKPKYILREIHRQAADSPIIKWAYSLRQGASIEEKFSGICHISCSGKGASFVASTMRDRNIDRMIVKTNEQRIVLNEAVRKLRGMKRTLEPGDEIMCLANNKNIGSVNGDIFTVMDVLKNDKEYVWAELRNEYGQFECMIYKPQFGRIDRTDEELPDECMLADYAYAATCHKFQGSSERHIGIAARGYCGDERRWNYTAATRAEEEVTVFTK